jgi:transcriptional regulator GlxA family with amidase domain
MSARLDSRAFVDVLGKTRHGEEAMNDRSVPLRFVSMGRAFQEASASDLQVNDAYVERALAAMRTDPARRWTVASLARVAGLSRAPFARRFRRATGTSPLRWLAGHRLGLARTRLVETDLALAAIAGEIGYSSDFAFAKAFKRLFGVAPGIFRRVAPAPRQGSAVPIFRAAA